MDAPMSQLTNRSLLLLCLVAPLAVTALACGKRGAEGIPECDAYFKTIDGCANTDEKGMLQSASNLEKDAWKRLNGDAVKAACIERDKYAKDRCDVGPAGVPECDEYFKIIETCKNETQKTNAKQFRDQWKSMPKSNLKKTCATSLEMAKTFCK